MTSKERPSSVRNRPGRPYPLGAIWDGSGVNFALFSENATGVELCLFVDTALAWGGDRPLRTPWNETVIYEAHVKGFTQRHPEVSEELRGTYAGLIAPAALEHLKALGVTAVELMPVHQFVSDRYLKEKGLSNYWGYNSIGFFAPD